MSSTLVRAALLCLAALSSTSVLAKVEVESGEQKPLGRVLVAKVSEEISPGDYDALLKGLRAHPGKFARKIVLLDSIGGSAAEAMRMGRLLRETGFDSLVPSTGVCQGSCVYLLAAGLKKTVKGHVAIHRPPFPAGDSAQSSRAGMPYNVSGYLSKMGVAPSLASDMQAIEPQRMKVLTAQELARYRLN
ncbi:periplasmic-like protein [Pseudomonas sp. ML96]|uniref:COG3904 family protein n=1 Tax=Pseudomonas sp. ML96 TaxID=1523503 RepID=UPI0005B96E45|nr:periplasmic-like protein [Pseudomonas sp. ML96]